MSYKMNQKLKLMRLMQIISEKTDDDHPLTAKQLCEELKRYGIVAERKSIYSDIEVLIEYGMDINKAYGTKQGFYLASREFEIPEIRLLMDAVSSAPFITMKKTKHIIKKLESLLSVYQAEKLESQIFIEEKTKFRNEEIYYSIDAIHRAIYSNKKIVFNYHSKKIINGSALFDEGRKLKVSPYALVWIDGKYHLLANEDGADGKITDYRLDHIKTVDLVNENIVNNEQKFSISDYMEKGLENLWGKQNTVELVCSKGILDAVIDKFGSEITLVNNDVDSFIAVINVYLSDILIKWIIQNGDNVYVKSPVSLRNRVMDKVTSIKKLYDRNRLQIDYIQ